VIDSVSTDKLEITESAAISSNKNIV